MKRTVSFLLAAMLLIGLLPFGANAATVFLDVKPDDYYFIPVQWALSHSPQITMGTGAHTFSPNDPCTRAQVVTFLWRAAGEPKAKVPINPFKDVPSGSYYTDAVVWAVEKNITTGTTSTTFSPNQGCTRGQVVTFLWRAAGKPYMGGSNPFRDVKSGDYYYNAVLWAVDEQITNGVDAAHFAPNTTCTRGQIVTFLYRRYVPKQPVTDADLQLVRERFLDAIDFVHATILNGKYNDKNDTITRNQIPYYRLTNANTKSEFRAQLGQYFEDAVAENLFHYSKYVEQDGKLYISQLQYGAPACGSCALRVAKDSTSQFTVTVTADFDGSVGSSVMHLRNVSGNWVWDTYDDLLTAAVWPGTRITVTQ